MLICLNNSAVSSAHFIIGRKEEFSPWICNHFFALKQANICSGWNIEGCTTASVLFWSNLPLPISSLSDTAGEKADIWMWNGIYLKNKAEPWWLRDQTIPSKNALGRFNHFLDRKFSALRDRKISACISTEAFVKSRADRCAVKLQGKHTVPLRVSGWRPWVQEPGR